MSERQATSVRARAFGGSPKAYWCANLLLIVIAAVVVFLDSRVDAVFNGQDSAYAVFFRVSWSGPILFVAAMFTALVQVMLLIGLWIGSVKFRQLKALTVLIALLSCSLGFVLNCRTIAWQGRRWRLSNHVLRFERYAKPLADAWPSQDGDLRGIGPFMAYPVGRPRTLILLTPPRVFEDGPAISAIERSDDGAIRFELSDRDGDWIEWRRTGAPASHVGGLQERRQLIRASSIARRWYLVRYRDTAGAGM